MPFSFLNPWLWLGAAAVAAPIWLHLRRKRQTNLFPFSAVRFLEDQPQPRRSPLRLQDLLLFVLRVLAVLLIVAAFAWPFIKGINTVPIRESRVYILDNTLSRQVDNGFIRDRDRVARDLRAAGPDVQVAVVELTSTPRVLVTFGEDHQGAEQRIEKLQPSFQRGPYLAAFREANSLLANSLGETKRIIFLGDNQENQWSENANTPPFLRNVQLDLPPTSTRALPNLALSDPRVQRIFLGDKSLVHFTARLTHSGPAKTAMVSLRANGQAIFNRPVDLDNQPETILLQAQWEADPASWLRGEATLEATPDVLPADNHIFFSLAPVIEGKVALLAQSPYLRLALSPDIMRGQWSTHLLDPANLDSELSADREADVLCIESGYLQSSQARKLVSRYLSEGRGVFLVVNRSTPAVDGCLRELGFEPEGTVRTEADAPEKFQFVFSNHPIFHPFLSPDYGNLMEIRISEFVRLKPAQALPLVFSENGAGLFFQGTKSKGKLFVAAFGLDREHTSWPIHQTFIPFLDLTLQAARAEDPTPTSFEPGQLGVVQFSGSAAGAREAALREDGRELAHVVVDHGQAQFRMPDRPGIYEVTGGDRGEVQKLLTVNPSPKESQLQFVAAPEAIKTWRVERPGENAKPALSPARAQVRLAGVLQQQLWWWMVLGGLAALLLEMAVAGARKEGV